MRIVKGILIFISIIAFCPFAKCQNAVTIKLDQSDIQSKEYADFPVDLCLFQYNIFKLKKAGFDVELPSVKDVKDTAVAFLLIDAAGSKFPSSYAPIFILNYRSNSPIILYQPFMNKKNVFKNVKLNEQIIFNTENKGAVRYIATINNTSVNERSSIVFPKAESDTISSRYWLYQIPLFIKSGEFKMKNSRIMIGLVDANQNGVYNDYNTDMVFIANKSKIISTSESSSCVPIKQGLTLNINNQLYQLIALDKNGNAVQLEKSSKVDSGDVRLLTTLPNLKYENLSDVQRSLSANLESKKFLFVYFWNTRCLNCPQYIEGLKEIYTLNLKRLNVLALNWENSKSEMADYVKSNGLIWEHGLSSPDVSIKLNQNRVPYGILFDETGTLVKEITNIDELREFFKK